MLDSYCPHFLISSSQWREKKYNASFDPGHITCMVTAACAVCIVDYKLLLLSPWIFPPAVLCHWMLCWILCTLLLKQDYPKHRHPGWNKGSIGYRADDGKIFIGSGIGHPFGPRCHKEDRMGCGILFPRDYMCQYDRYVVSAVQTAVYDLLITSRIVCPVLCASYDALYNLPDILCIS